MKRFLASVLAVGLFAASAQADLLVYETFEHQNGNLVGQTPTPGPGAEWGAHSGAGNLPVQVVNGAAVLEQGGGSREDVNVGIGGALGAGQTLYAGFDLVNTGGTTTVYFGHFAVSASVFNSRVFISAPTAGGDYSIGFSNTSTIAATWGSDLLNDETYRIVHSYDFDSGESRLWVNPTDETSPSISVNNGFAGDAVIWYALRQAAGNSTQTIDNLRVATTFGEAVPEPTSLLLLGAGALALIRRR